MFTFDRVNKKSAVFDMNKLNWINSEYIKMSDENVIAGLINEHLKVKNIPLQENGYLVKVIGLMKERAAVISDFVEFGKYFFSEPQGYDEKGLAKHWAESIKPVFNEYFEQLKNISDWTLLNLEENLRKFADTKGIKAGQLIHVLRLALTGITISPGIFELMEVLGKDKVMQRLREFLAN
jgi:glutamyl-tRNA synthetase